MVRNEKMTLKEHYSFTDHKIVDVSFRRTKETRMMKRSFFMLFLKNSNQFLISLKKDKLLNLCLQGIRHNQN